MRPEKIPAPNSARALDRVIVTGETFISRLPETAGRREFALNKLQEAVATLESQAGTNGAEHTGPEAPFQQAAILAQSGYVLLEAERAMASGQNAQVKEALRDLQAARLDLTEGPKPLAFQKDLLQSKELPPELSAALEEFERRAELTLENMVVEARDVIRGALTKFADNFENLIRGLAHLAESFSAEGAGLLKAAVEKIIAGLRILAEYLKSEKLKAAIDYVRDAIKEADLIHLLERAFECKDTKVLIRRLSTSTTHEKLQSANDRMAEMSSHFVLLLKRAGWILAAVRAAGTLLVLTGTGVVYAELGVPAACLIVVVAILIIGIQFADSDMRTLLAEI